ncbi:MAG: hypothetical protein JSV77_04505 [Dehalococcoidales bacterium]|nr:MAG: hypothetical protein JSV77_11420 [Dehalococcoidales bacterium]UCB43912.1 MAG: hypothetical protein JSV77_04505 [Dehalococcoidales bacterium]
MKILDNLRKRGARRTFQRLYEYWLEKDIPSVENTASRRIDEHERLEDQSINGDLTLREALQRQLPKIPKPRDTVQLRLPIRYVFMGAALIALLLVALAIVSTVLIMRSC